MWQLKSRIEGVRQLSKEKFLRKVARRLSVVRLISLKLVDILRRLLAVTQTLLNRRDLGDTLRFFGVISDVVTRYERKFKQPSEQSEGLSAYNQAVEEVQRANGGNGWEAASIAAKTAAQIQLKFRGVLGPIKNLRIIGPSITESIGHLASALSLAVGLRNLGLDSTENEYLVLSSGTPNPDYLQLWSEHVTLFDNGEGLGIGTLLEETLWPWTQSVLFSETSEGAMFLPEAKNLLHVEWERHQKGPLLSMQPEQIEAGDEFCKTLNVDPAAPLVTIHVRNGVWGVEGARNARFDSYAGAIEYLLSKGFTVVKLGNSTIGSVAFEHGFIDLQVHGHAHSWLENYFLAKSSFLIGTTSGPILMAWTFGVPILWTNAPDLNATIYYPNSLVVPKLVRSPRGRVLSLEELSDSRFSNSDADIQHLPDSRGATGYSWVDNSESMILAATKEMISNLALGTTLDRRQEQAREMILSSGLSACTPISQAFLREHSNF